jgi:hypothetical protein
MASLTAGTALRAIVVTLTGSAAFAACSVLFPVPDNVSPGGAGSDEAGEPDAPASANDASCQKDLELDPANCGACGHDCAEAACSRGLCVPTVITRDAVKPMLLAVRGDVVYWTGETPINGIGGTMPGSQSNGMFAQYRRAKSEYDRATTLFEHGSISTQDKENAYYELKHLEAMWSKASAESALVQTGSRVEDIAAAKARLAAADAKLRLAEDTVRRRKVTAPSDGDVLDLGMELGESAGPGSARPVAVVADLRRRRVRAFIEELDAARVRIGQESTVSADAAPDRTWKGVVTEVLPRMGRRRPPSDAAGEYRDVYFREVLIELDGACDLPVNLRVSVRVEELVRDPGAS